MRFVDEAVISVKAGKGGNGCAAVRRENFVPPGGPAATAAASSCAPIRAF